MAGCSPYLGEFPDFKGLSNSNTILRTLNGTLKNFCKQVALTFLSVFNLFEVGELRQWFSIIDL